MTDIQEILKLPKEEQMAIMEAIQENFEETAFDENELNNEQIDFIKKRVDEIENGNYKTFTWAEVQQAIKNRWNTK
ncbi:MAG: addiction module protein [Chitinophagaceae bacterium]